MCRGVVSIIKERIDFDLEVIFESPSESVMIFQNLLNETMDFDDYLSTTWGIDSQETPLLFHTIQTSEYFGNWLIMDCEVYSSLMNSNDSDDVPFQRCKWLEFADADSFDL